MPARPVVAVALGALVSMSACATTTPGTDAPAPQTTISSRATLRTTMPTPTPTPPAIPSSPLSSGPAERTEPSLVGETANAWAFAPIDTPEDVVVEGEVPRQRAWSTSKVLIAAAFIADAAAGDPTRLSEQHDQWVRRAMSESDMDSLLAMRRAISGDRQGKLQAILTGVGDEVTRVPAEKEGTMDWAVEDQVRFMAALARGEVVAPATSAYLLEAMQPIASQRWGLAAIEAEAVKGGWLTPTTETRQMGIVGGYAVAIITDAVGPAVLQSDGDEAHVEQMTELAGMLAERLGSR